jgi:hypothetical protein
MDSIKMMRKGGSVMGPCRHPGHILHAIVEGRALCGTRPDHKWKDSVTWNKRTCPVCAAKLTGFRSQ